MTCVSHDCMTLTTTFLQSVVLYTVSSLNVCKCYENGVVTWVLSVFGGTLFLLWRRIHRLGQMEVCRNVSQISHTTLHSIVWQLIDKFRETGSVADTPRSGRPRVLTEDKVLDISYHIMQSPKCPFANCHSKQASYIHQHRVHLKNNCTCIHTR
jgi:hypothetical protein